MRDEIIISLISFAIGALIGITVVVEIFKKATVEKGCAEYSRTTGDWNWKVTP